jgi:hypothetical protein
MKSQPKKTHKLTKLAIALLVAVLLVALVFVAPRLFTQANSNTKNGNQTTTEHTSPNATDNTNKTPQNNEPVVDGQINNSAISANITYIRNEDSSIRIGTLIEGVISDGSCVLTMSKDNQTVTRNVGIQALASSSTCKGFNVPVAELSPGTWTIKIDINSNSKEAHLSDSVKID